MTATIIPDLVGTRLIAFWGDGTDEGLCETYPVLAWMVTVHDGEVNDVQPIICESMPNVWCLEERVNDTRTWRFVEDCMFTDFEAARTHARRQLALREKYRKESRPASAVAPHAHPE